MGSLFFLYFLAVEFQNGVMDGGEAIVWRPLWQPWQPSVKRKTGSGKEDNFLSHKKARKRNFVTFFGQLIDRWTLMESVLVVT